MKKSTLSIKILRTLAVVFLVLQIFSYLGRIKLAARTIADPAEMIGYYLGLNIALIISIILFLVANRLQRKHNRANLQEQINSIGE
jgi:uncharacterized membrane protein